MIIGDKRNINSKMGLPKGEIVSHNLQKSYV